MKNQLKSKLLILPLMFVGWCLGFQAPVSLPAVSAAPSDESEVRNAVQRIFDQLKSGQYEALYDALPSSSRSRMSRERFVKALQGSRNMYQLERIEIGPTRVSGNLAVVDTTMYARIAQPLMPMASWLCNSIWCAKTASGAWQRAIQGNTTW